MTFIPANGKCRLLDVSHTLRQHFLRRPVVNGQPYINFGDLDITHHAIALEIEDVLIIARQRVPTTGDKWVVDGVTSKTFVVFNCRPMSLRELLLAVSRNRIAVLLNRSARIFLCKPIAHKRIRHDRGPEKDHNERRPRGHAPARCPRRIWRGCFRNDCTSATGHRGPHSIGPLGPCVNPCRISRI